MKKVLVSMFVLSFLLIGFFVHAGEDGTASTKFHLASVSGFDKESEYQILTDEQFKQLEDEMKTEARFFSKALAEAGKDWKKNEDHKGKSFPRGAVSKRYIKVLQVFRSMDEANKKLDSYKTRESRAAEKEKEKAKKGGGSKKSKEDQLKEDQRKAARDANDNEARSLFELKLKEAIGGAAKDEPAKDKK